MLHLETVEQYTNIYINIQAQNYTVLQLTLRLSYNLYNFKHPLRKPKFGNIEIIKQCTHLMYYITLEN